MKQSVIKGDWIILAEILYEICPLFGSERRFLSGREATVAQAEKCWTLSSGESCSLSAKAANQESVAPVGTPTAVGATASHFLSTKLFEYIYIHIYPQCNPMHLLLLIFDSMRSSMASLPNLPSCLVLPRATQVLGSA